MKTNEPTRNTFWIGSFKTFFLLCFEPMNKPQFFFFADLRNISFKINMRHIEDKPILLHYPISMSSEMKANDSNQWLFNVLNQCIMD